MNETLKRLLISGFVVIAGGTIYWNFPDNDPMCLEYNKDEKCIDERTKEQVCEDMLGDFVIRADNMKAEKPDPTIKRLRPQEMKVWDLSKKNGCPPPNGVYDISGFYRTPGYVYASVTKKNERKTELAGKFRDKTINWVEKNEVKGILQAEANPLIGTGKVGSDASLLDALEK